jgi:hypothetical protein
MRTRFTFAMLTVCLTVVVLACGRTDTLVGDAEGDGSIDTGVDALDGIAEDPFSAPTWARSYSGSMTEYFRAVQVTDEGHIVTAGSTRSFGTENQDMWVVLLDKWGDPLWEKALPDGGLQDAVNFIAEVDSGGWIVGGTGMVYEAIARLDSEGEVLWRWQAVDGGTEYFADAVRAPGGQIAACLIFDVHVGFLLLGDDGTIIESKYYPDDLSGDHQNPLSIISPSDGGFLIVGKHWNSPGWPGHDGLAMRLDERGDLIWAHKYKSDRSELFTDAAEVLDGFLMVGMTAEAPLEPSRGWIVTIDKDGGLLKQQVLEIGEQCYLDEVLATSDGGLVATGIVYTGAKMDILLLKLDSTGNVLWARTYGGLWVSTTAGDVVQAPDGGFVVVGSYEVLEEEPADGWVLRTDPDGYIDGDCPEGMITTVGVTVLDSEVWVEEPPIRAAEADMDTEWMDTESLPTSARVEQQCP